MDNKRFCLLIFLFFLNFKLARVKYEGGGDWYNDPEILPNLAREISKRTELKIEPVQDIVEPSDKKIFQYPFLFLTGHGRVSFSQADAKNLREYLLKGGFLYIDDDYGMDEYIREEIKKIFPEKELVLVPYDHPIYHIFYDFENGPPKIHEHYPGPPQGLGIFHEGRLLIFYTYNSNISDGWTDAYNDPPEKQEEAIRMGINIVLYAILY
jgi:hypothetical protein